ncbi:MAG: aminotransferase class IV [Pseudomonadota bacterium]
MEPDQQTVPESDRSFLYGHGVFETMLCLQGRITLRRYHLDRLRVGAERLSITIGEGELQDALKPVAQLTGAHIVRLHLSSGSGPRGYATQDCGPSRFSVQTFPLAHDPLAVAPAARVCRSRTPIALQPALAGIKHCNRLEQVLAASEARERGFDEALMCSQADEVHCATAANVFVLQGALLRTPDCGAAGVAGTRRRLILEELAERAGLRVEVGRVTAADCRRADALLLTSAGVGIRHVSEFEGHRFEPRDAVSRLQAAYIEELRACLDA